MKGHLLCVDRGLFDHVGISDGKGYVYENSYNRFRGFLCRPLARQLLVGSINPALKGLVCGAGIGVLLKNNPHQVIKNSLIGASFGFLTGLILSYNNNKNKSNGTDAIIQEANLQKMDGDYKNTI